MKTRELRKQLEAYVEGLDKLVEYGDSAESYFFHGYDAAISNVSQNLKRILKGTD